MHFNENEDLREKNPVYQEFMLVLPVQYNLHNLNVFGAKFELPQMRNHPNI
jgi:hypothetical protein